MDVRKQPDFDRLPYIQTDIIPRSCAPEARGRSNGGKKPSLQRVINLVINAEQRKKDSERFAPGPKCSQLALPLEHLVG